MPSDTSSNDFLVELLALQQDGNRAISAPTNWTTQEPMLEVVTEVDQVVERLVEAILRGPDENSVGRWHFFIGSPGNGKSAAVGKLCRHLIGSRGCHVRDEQGCPIQDLEALAVPYALDVFEADNPFFSARIVQDASVVRNPYSPDVDPARELASTLEEAWERGVALIVCTNRGVLEKAHRDNHMDRRVNTSPWFKALTAVVESELTLQGEWGVELEVPGRRPVFRKMTVSYTHLDNRSLLIGSDIFDRLVQKAIEPVHWEACGTCAAAALCPFKNNRDWLADESGRTNVLVALRRGEALSGQIVVFREALAIVSLVLAGCPRDYGETHPCDWVRQKVASGDIFSLAARRIYMSLFASFAPSGLEPPVPLRERQLEALSALIESIGDRAQQARTALSHVVSARSHSTDVGITRLLGEEGVLAQIDPCREPLPSRFYDLWDSDFSAIVAEDIPLLTEVERRCVEVWSFLERVIESTADHTVFRSHWALRRWSSNFLLHFGALLEGLTAWSRELDEFLDLLEIVVKEPGARTIHEKRKIRELDERLECLLDAHRVDATAPGSVQLSEGVRLVGRWVGAKLKPRTMSREKSRTLSLSVAFEGGEQATIGASSYIWLSRCARGKLDPRSFPPDLLMGAVDARIRAAARGRYAFQDDDVELMIDTGEGAVFRLVRYDGDVDVRDE